MLKILHIIPSLKRAGAERLVLDICNELVEKKMAEVLLLVMYPKNEYPELSENIKIVYCSSRVYPSLSGKSKANLEEFTKIVRDFKPDIIHSHLFEAEMMSRWKIFPHIKYVSHAHDNMIQLKKIKANTLFSKQKFTNFYERNLLFKKYKECNNNFIAISEDTNIYLKNNLPEVFQNNIYLLHNAIDFFKFKRSSDLIPSIVNKEIKLVNIGSFVNKKNQSFLIDVISYLRRKNYNITLELLGDGINKKEVENRINEAGLATIIFCRGNVHNIEDYLHKSHIYVHSATYEPFGLVLLEAMASGLPVVSLDGKGNRDVVKNGVNGFMLEKPDVIIFAKKIIELATKLDLYKSMSENAVKFAADFDIKNYVDKLMQLYNKILHQ